MLKNRPDKQKVLIIQPVIPEYRIPFFKRLVQNEDFEFTIFAGKKIYWGPPSSQAAADFSDLNHETIKLFGGIFFWQNNIWIPKSFGRNDILVLSGNPRLLNNNFLIIQARLRKLKVIWWGQGWSAGSKLWRVAIRRQLMKLVDIIILYTEKEVCDYINMGFNKNILFGLNNTIDTENISIIRRKWDLIRLEKFKMEYGFLRQFNLLFVGRITKKTQLDVALKALALLPKDQYELLVIGDGIERIAYQNLAQEFDVSDRVRWLGTIYDEEVLAPYFLIANCFVYPGAIGLSLLHAFSYGLPVCIHNNDLDHGPEFSALRDGLNGFIFRQDDPHHLASKIEQVCNDVELLESMRKNALFCVENEFSIKHMVKAFENALNCTDSLC